MTELNSHKRMSNSNILPLYHPEYFLLKEKIDELNERIEYLESMTLYHSKKISLSFQSRLDTVTISDIVRCESDNNYCHIILTDETRLLLSKTLKCIQNKINHPYFHRIHRSHLINQNYVRSIEKGSVHKILMADGMTLPISRNFNIQTIL